MAKYGSYTDMPSTSNYTVANVQCNKNLFEDSGELMSDTQEPVVSSVPPATKDPAVEEERFKVFLRLKPSGACNTREAVEILDDKRIVTRAPSGAASRRRIEEEYSFTKVFGPESSQKDIFEECTLNLVKKLFRGNNCLLFTYGTSSAGKTYTVQGTKKKPGLIPRTLALIFKTVRQGRLLEVPYIPDKADSIIRLTPETFERHLSLKESILSNEEFKDLNPSLEPSAVDSSYKEFLEAAMTFKAMENVLNKEVQQISLDDDNRNAKFILWVSFIEIYNEAVYDLLKPVNSITRARQPLKLARDCKSNSYIKDLCYINVTNELDAYKIFLYGKQNLQMASTSLNKHSSRSHCVFSIILIRAAEAENESSCQISRFTICDLAGAERQKNTLNIGDRLTESKKINSSLHVLSRCFTIMRENQLRTHKIRVPFRESKLTTLFQKAFSGEEPVTMIVNVSPDSKLYDETQQVLRSSAIAKAIVMRAASPTRIKKVRRSQNFSKAFSQHVSAGTGLESAIVPILTEFNEDVSASQQRGENLELIETLKRSNRSLQETCKKLKKKLREVEEENTTLEAKIRSELFEEYQKLFCSSQSSFQKRLADGKKKLEDMVLVHYDLNIDEEKEERQKKATEGQKSTNETFVCDLSAIPGPSSWSDEDKEKITQLTEELSQLKKQLKNQTEEAMKLKADLTNEKKTCSELREAYEKSEELLKESCNEILVHLENVEVLKQEVEEHRTLVVHQAEKINELHRISERFQIELESVKWEYEEKIAEANSKLAERLDAIRSLEQKLLQKDNKLKELEEERSYSLNGPYKLKQKLQELKADGSNKENTPPQFRTPRTPLSGRSEKPHTGVKKHRRISNKQLSDQHLGIKKRYDSLSDSEAITKSGIRRSSRLRTRLVSQLRKLPDTSDSESERCDDRFIKTVKYKIEYQEQLASKDYSQANQDVNKPIKITVTTSDEQPGEKLDSDCGVSSDAVRTTSRSKSRRAMKQLLNQDYVDSELNLDTELIQQEDRQHQTVESPLSEWQRHFLTSSTKKLRTRNKKNK